jgi:hypothetical protein
MGFFSLLLFCCVALVLLYVLTLQPKTWQVASAVQWTNPASSARSPAFPTSEASTWSIADTNLYTVVLHCTIRIFGRTPSGMLDNKISLSHKHLSASVQYQHLTSVCLSQLPQFYLPLRVHQIHCLIVPSIVGFVQWALPVSLPSWDQLVQRPRTLFFGWWSWVGYIHAVHPVCYLDIFLPFCMQSLPVALTLFSHFCANIIRTHEGEVKLSCPLYALALCSSISEGSNWVPQTAARKCSRSRPITCLGGYERRWWCWFGDYDMQRCQLQSGKTRQ